MQGDIIGRVDRRRAGCRAAVHQVLGDLGLAVDHDGLAGQLLEVDAVAHAFDADLRPVMHEALAVHAGADAGLVDQIDRDLLDHAGADAAQHVLAGVPLEDDVVDAVLVEQLAEQQAGRAGADDRDLRSHVSPFVLVFHRARPSQARRYL